MDEREGRGPADKRRLVFSSPMTSSAAWRTRQAREFRAVSILLLNDRLVNAHKTLVAT